MAYKRIDAAIRNFAHSFGSVMNYFDDTYIVDVLPKLIRETPEGTIRVSLLDHTITPQREYARPFLQSISNYRARVRDHLRSENVDPSLLTCFDFVLFADDDGVICRAYATDDRGKTHSMDVRSNSDWS